MSHFMEIVTPPEVPAEVTAHSPTSQSASIVSTSSLARWRMTQGTAEKVTSGGSPSAIAKSDSAGLRQSTEERRARRLPQVIFTEATEREMASAHNSPREAAISGASPNRSTSIEERSYRAMVSDSVRRSLNESHMDVEEKQMDDAAISTSPVSQHRQQKQQQQMDRKEPHAVVGDEPVRWSFTSASPLSSRRLQPPHEPHDEQQQNAMDTDGDNRATEQHGEVDQAPLPQLNTIRSNAESPTAIAAAVPAIAHARDAAAEDYAGRWNAEVRKSTAGEEEWIRAYRQLEAELRSAEKKLSAAEVRQQREVAALKAQLATEQAAREKAERDREDLLNQATMSPAVTPRTVGGGVLHVSVEDRSRSHSAGVDGASGKGTASAKRDNGGEAEVGATGTATTTATYISEAFYEQMKEREDRARARVRKEFVRQAQESVYAEQKKTAEAEKTAALATRRLQQVEEELQRTQEGLEEANSVLEAKDVQLHERAIHIQELEAQLRLVQRQLQSAEEAQTQGEALARRKLEEAQKLADLRQSELEAQRSFAQQLQEQLGLKTRDLFDQESSQQSVLQLVVGLQTRCTALEADLEAAVKEATALLDQRRQHAESAAAALRQRNEELQTRCAAAEGEVAAMQGQRACDAKEMALLRERYEKDLSDQHVEVRSLQLQLEKVLAAAKHRSAESMSAAELERQQQGALVRKYAAEATAAQEELDRTRAMAHRENEKHLRTILELSQQLTALKQANTRLEHRVNIHEHESADATRLLSRAREELTQLREERRRLSASLVDFREDSRMRSALDSHDVLQRRVAELENVRRDLHEKLLDANQTIEDMQRRSHYLAEPSGRYSHSDSRRPPSVQGVVSADAPQRILATPSQEPRASPPQEEEKKTVEPTAQRPSAQTSVIAVTPSISLPELLESMVEQIGPIIHPQLHRLNKGKSGNKPDSVSAGSVPSSEAARQEGRLQHTLSPDERDALDRVLASCTAALRCSAKEKHVVDSPVKPAVRDQDNKGGRTSQENTAATMPSVEVTAGGAKDQYRRTASAQRHVPADQPSPLPSQWQSSPAADLHEPQRHSPSQSLPPSPQQQQEGATVLHANLPSPQQPLARPRRSSQPSLSSVATDDFLMRFSHTSEAFPTPLAQRRNDNNTADGIKQRCKEQSGSQEEAEEHKRNKESIRQPQSTNKTSQVVPRESGDNRDELESEPCWDSRISEPASASRRGDEEKYDESSEASSHRSHSSSSDLESNRRGQDKVLIQASRASEALLEPTSTATPSTLNVPPSRPRRSVASVTASSAALSASPSVAHSTRDVPLAVKFSPKTPSVPYTANAILSITQMSEEAERDGIVRYSRIPDEALSPMLRKESRAALITGAPATRATENFEASRGNAVLSDSDASPSLFSNVQYVSAGSSVSRSSQHRPSQHRHPSPSQRGEFGERELRNVTSSTTGHAHHRQQATVPGGALVIDVRQSTPPPPRKRMHLQ